MRESIESDKPLAAKRKFSRRFVRNRAGSAIKSATKIAGKSLEIVKVDNGALTRTCVKTRCQHCGKERVVAIGDFNLGKGKYCSHKCSLAANMVYKKGTQHHNWRGGRRDSHNRYIKNNASKIYCRTITRGAIGLGWIKVKPCEVCGSEDSQIHHTDYTQPFLVYFLCRKHHLDAHGGSFHNPPLRATNKWTE